MATCRRCRLGAGISDLGFRAWAGNVLGSVSRTQRCHATLSQGGLRMERYTGSPMAFPGSLESRSDTFRPVRRGNRSRDREPGHHRSRGAARPGHFLGVYEPGSDQSWTPVQAFATAVGHQPDIVLMYSNWFERFQRAFAERAAAHGAIPMIQLQPMNISLPAIVAGRYDTYLRSYATAVRSFGHPVILS